MITVPHAVYEIIQKTPFLEEGLQKGIINLSALARQIKPEVEERTFKTVGESAIIMALKRLEHTIKPKGDFKKIFQSTPDLIVRSNLLEITLENSLTLVKKQIKLRQYTDENPFFVTVTRGVFETTVIASHELEHFLNDLYTEEKIISKLTNLSSITVKFSHDIIGTAGIYYMVLKSLAWENIPFTELVSTYSEVTIVLEHDYVDRAFSLIKRLFSK